jgi:hypothetical protein
MIKSSNSLEAQQGETMESGSQFAEEELIKRNSSTLFLLQILQLLAGATTTVCNCRIPG